MSRYWTCQIVGWSLTGLMTVGIPSLYGGLRWSVVIRAIVGAGLGAALTHTLRAYMRRRGWLQLSLARLAPRIVGAALIVAAAMVIALLPLLALVIRGTSLAGPVSAIYVSHVAIVFGWLAIYFAYHYVERIRTTESEKWRLELTMRDTELLALRAQLNPHFLFNSLNSLRALVAEDPARAQEAITALAGLLRYTLQASRARTTTLGEELEATGQYLELEAIRFESRLLYEMDVDSRALEHRVPPMLVQTLVENAVKHGIARLPEGGFVRVEVRKPQGELRIRVTNSGVLRAARGHGIGLTNSLERLRLLFGEGVTIELGAADAGEVTCEVVVPSPRAIAREAVMGASSGT